MPGPIFNFPLKNFNKNNSQDQNIFDIIFAIPMFFLFATITIIFIHKYRSIPLIDNLYSQEIQDNQTLLPSSTTTITQVNEIKSEKIPLKKE